MNQEDFEAGSRVGQDRPPGEAAPPGEGSIDAELRGYLIGLGFSIVLTAASFWAVATDFIYGPGVIMAIAMLALAQMGIHLVFFLHLTTAPDNMNTVVALAFGILIAGLIIFGSVWVMYHLDHNMIPMQELLRMQP